MSRSRRAHNALPNSVGELELKVMEKVWATPGIDARAITDELSAEAPCRLSAVQATLERLVRKNMLARHKRGHAYRYTAVQSRGDLLGSMLRDVIRLLHDGQANTILSSFVNVAARLDDSALDELEAMIRRKRQLDDQHNKGERSDD